MTRPTQPFSKFEPLESRRLLAGWAIDATFADDGTADLPNYGRVVKVLADGKILAGGNEGVKRLLPDGRLDGAFVDMGTAINNGRGSMNLVVGDRVIIAGWATTNSNQSFFVRAIKLSNGDVDATFGDNGVLYFTPAPAQPDAKQLTNNLTSLIANADGTLLLGASQSIEVQPPRGEIYGELWNADFVYKINTSGRIDTTFGNGGGRLTIENDQDDEVWPHLAAMPNAVGKFYVLGETRAWSSALWRYNANGKPDTTFGGGDGIVPITVGGQFPGFDQIVVQPDGKILLPWDENPDFGDPPDRISRLNADGSVDTSFGGGDGTGILKGNVGGITMDPQGRIIGGGEMIFRLTPQGDPDSSFDDDGYITTTGFFGVAIAAQDRVIAGDGQQIVRFAPGAPVQLAPDGTLRIDGTDEGDLISVTLAGGTVTVTRDSVATTFSAAAVKAVIVNGFEGDDFITVAIDVPTTVHGGAGRDSIATAGGNDSIYGNEGADTVDSGGGNDVIFGGYGGDSLFGNAGADIIWGDRGADSVAGGDGNDRLFGDGPNDFPGDGVFETDDDSLSGNAGNDRIDGMRGNDRVAGNGGRDRLFGGDSDDRIYGGASGDWLFGGVGNDQFFGEGGLDRLYADDEQNPEWGRDTLHGNAGNDIFVTRDAAIDELFGDGGTDSGFYDDSDLITSIEQTL